MDGNRRDSGCRPFFAHVVIRNLSGRRLVFTDKPVIFGVNPCQDYARLSVSR